MDGKTLITMSVVWNLEEGEEELHFYVISRETHFWKQTNPQTFL